MYYPHYIKVHELVGLQQPVTKSHDEMLFIIVHQSHELWFKQIIHELKWVTRCLAQEEIDDNGEDVGLIVHRLERIVGIWRLLVYHIDVLETMTPLDFLDFRSHIVPASGFQSYQFRVIEARMGLRFNDRHAGDFYKGKFAPNEVEEIRDAEESTSLLQGVNEWLERTPFVPDGFWDNYRKIYEKSLEDNEREVKMKSIDGIINGEIGDSKFSPASLRSSLFIMLYRDYPILQFPYRLINSLIDIDEQMTMWRHRHISMVRRMIGTRVGTGGSIGGDYLEDAMKKHIVFNELTQMASYLVERSVRPPLPDSASLGFAHKYSMVNNAKQTKT